MYKKYVVVEGNAYSRGVQIGKELKNQISINYQNQTKYYRDKEDFNYRKWGDMAKRYIPAMEKWTPEVMEEIKGMAEGAQMELEQILALTTAYEKSFSRDMISEKCTSFLLAPKATYAQKVIVGQTNEECILEWMNELDTVIHHVDNGKESLIYTHPGVPAYTGINNQGLAVLWEYIDNGRTGDGVPTNAIIRHLLECANVGEAVEFLKMVPHDVPNEFGIADKSGKIVSVECFPNKVYVGRDEKYLVHTNHIVFGKEETDDTRSIATKTQYTEMENQIKKNLGNIDIEMAQNFLRSHENFPNSICAHLSPERPWNRVLAAVVQDLTCGEMHVAFGNPCETDYKKYRFRKYPINNK